MVMSSLLGSATCYCQYQQIEEPIKESHDLLIDHRVPVDEQHVLKNMFAALMPWFAACGKLLEHLLLGQAPHAQWRTPDRDVSIVF